MQPGQSLAYSCFPGLPAAKPGTTRRAQQVNGENARLQPLMNLNLSFTAAGRRTFRDILCHSRLPLGNSPANPEQRRENRELVHTELRAPFRGLRYSVLSTHMD